jgi:hypothetical protein
MHVHPFSVYLPIHAIHAVPVCAYACDSLYNGSSRDLQYYADSCDANLTTTAFDSFAGGGLHATCVDEVSDSLIVVRRYAL